MSTTTQPDASLDPSDIEPDDAFSALIWYNKDVCSNCFSRAMTTYTDVPTSGLSATPRSISYRTDHAGMDHDNTQHDEYGAIETYDPAVTCLECGSIRLLDQHDTLSTREMIELVIPIRDRLREYGINVHVSAMKRLIRKVKARTGVQGQDRELFEKATAFGIRMAEKHQ